MLKHFIKYLTLKRKLYSFKKKLDELKTVEHFGVISEKEYIAKVNEFKRKL